MSSTIITLFGAGFCPKTDLIKHHLQGEWVDFNYKDVIDDKAAEAEVRELYDGKLKYPTLVVNGTVYKNPSPAKLREILKDLDLD